MVRLRRNGRRHHFTINYDAPLLLPAIGDLTLRSVMKGAVDEVRRENPNICDEIENGR